eukprot:TRINITY_DN5422_c2_g1_i1.p1 TRINITY_DN5422_c2_g1~~TRINITY_DN5422_c2_g1_i1.p1  ORF type:complete len:230 (+),score=-22.22 TRINITY_DN5422_c2_g1_i1:455-1144(+)
MILTNTQYKYHFLPQQKIKKNQIDSQKKYSRQFFLSIQNNKHTHAFYQLYSLSNKFIHKFPQTLNIYYQFNYQFTLFISHNIINFNYYYYYKKQISIDKFILLLINFYQIVHKKIIESFFFNIIISGFFTKINFTKKQLVFIGSLYLIQIIFILINQIKQRLYQKVLIIIINLNKFPNFNIYQQIFTQVQLFILIIKPIQINNFNRKLYVLQFFLKNILNLINYNKYIL